MFHHRDDFERGRDSGILARIHQVQSLLKNARWNGEYALVSTKPNSAYSRLVESLDAGIPLIVDLYTPIFLEKELTLSKWKPQDWLTRWENKQKVKKFLERGNHFLTANKRQEQYWLETSKQLGVPISEKDVSIFPTGSGSQFPITNSQLPITDRKVVLWFGGIYPWMDPEPLVEAFSRICRGYPEWKLRILGGWQPGTGYKHRYEKLINKAKMSIPDSQSQIVDWQKNEDLGKFLEDVSFAVHLVKNSPEDYFAHRVRLLTLLNAGVGVVTSGQDVISDLLITMRAGERVEGNIEHVTERLDDLMTSDRTARTWSKHAPSVQAEFIKREQDRITLEQILRRGRVS